MWVPDHRLTWLVHTSLFGYSSSARVSTYCAEDRLCGNSKALCRQEDQYRSLPLKTVSAHGVGWGGPLVLCPSEAELTPPLQQGVSNICREHALGWAFPLYTHQLGMQGPLERAPPLWPRLKANRFPGGGLPWKEEPRPGAYVDDPGTSICV